MLSKKTYEHAALIVQETVDYRSHVIKAFVALFVMDGNPRFDRNRFLDACIPGANVKACGKKVKA